MRLRFLGTGTSTGVPAIGCKCEVCVSTDIHDKRLRASAILTTDEGENLLIDCGPDFRQQIIEAGAPRLDACLITHSHYDHVGGVDDLRPYCNAKHHFPMYCQANVASDLRSRVPYCFKDHPYPGVPVFDLNIVKEYEPFVVGKTEVLPLSIKHYMLDILGFRIGNFAYVTDAKIVPDRTVELLKGVDTLVINALRHEEHISHMTLEESVEIARRVDPRVTYFTHMADRIGLHEQVENSLPGGMHLAYDNLIVEIQ
ncbi:MAG: MBL fold metallo-hydrolase [Muribaculum sp.]|nr:MBL fold metallo-hydrolase [Muribaculaceae bacterium]MCM1080614.1 MBL fold metallo-hydrolase [Muribaculum sp.]